MSADSDQPRHTSYQGRTYWYMRQWGPPSNLVKSKMEDGVTEFATMIFPPRDSTPRGPGHNHWIYATNGMSERRMPCITQPHGDPKFRLELIAYARSEAPWIVDLLREVALYPFRHKSGLAIGHTLPVSDGVNGLWKGYLLTNPMLEPEEFNPLPIEIGIQPDWVFFAQLYGLLENELDRAIEIGGPAFRAEVSANTAGALPCFLDVDRRPK